MARVYADVNQHMPKSYWEYDSVNITWGVLENYEVVRKIGKRNHQSKLRRHRTTLTMRRSREVLGSFRRNQYCQLSEMRYQGPQAGQEKEDKARDQDSAELVRWAECRCITGCREGQPKQDAVSHIRICQ